MGMEQAQLGRYLVYKSTHRDGRETYATRAAVAPNAEGGLIWCVYDGSPGGGQQPTSVIATNAHGVTVWMQRLQPARKGRPAKTISEQDFRDAMRGLGRTAYLYRAPEATSAYPSHVVTLDRFCRDGDYVIETISRRSTAETEREREQNNQRLAAFGLLTMHYQFRDDGVLLRDRRIIGGRQVMETELAGEGDWDQPSCIEAVG